MERGEWLGGYRLIRRLGAGGAATVWEARDEGGMRVALKLLHPALSATQQARERLVREAATVNRVRTPGVARVLDLEVDAPQPFVATELVEGETLASRLARGPLPAEQAGELARQMAATLSTVHAAGVIHRDLKPSNVILSERGPVLIDFGIAQILDQERLTRAGMVSGTPGFVSPEVLRGAPVDAAADWWAWAATVLSACTGRPPFGTGPVEAVLERERLGSPDARGLAGDLVGAFGAALAPDPAMRAVPAALLGALGSAGAGPVAAADDAPTRVLGGADAPTRAVPLPGWGAPDDADSGATRVLGGRGPAGGADAADRGARAQPADPGRTRVLPQTSAEVPEPTRVLPPSAPEPQPADPGAWAPPGPVSAWPPPEPAPYVARPARPAPVTAALVLAALAMPPVLVGRAGGIAVLTVLVALATAGSARRWREARREAWGAPRRSDTPLMAARLPLHLVRGAVGVAAGLAAGLVAAAGAWIAARLGLSLGLAWTWPADLLVAERADLGSGSPLTDPVPLAVAWGLVWLALLVAWSTPAWRSAREGTYAALQRLLPPLWSRAVLCVLVLGVLATTWLVVTGGFA